MSPIALYMHIPFCVRKCAYCDFTSYAGAMDRLPAYLVRLETEIEEASAWPLGRHAGAGRELGPKARPVSTLYIGGGTPSLLSGQQIQQLLDAVRAHFDLLPDAEISMEANPGTIDGSKLLAYRQAGINRLSFGAQAMQPRLLQTLGRIHAWSDAESGVCMARSAGFKNLNIDLMYALPGQTIGDWRDTLAAAIALKPEHISAYSLILEEGTPLTGRVERGELAEPTEDTCVAMQRLATRMLSDAGLLRYEISNYAKPGFECRHNIAYWTRREYLGMGAAAHSLMGGARFSNTDELDYARSGHIALSERDAFEERIMLGTRMVRGTSCEGIDPAAIARLKGFIRTDGRRVWLTERGMEVQNQVVVKLIT